MKKTKNEDICFVMQDKLDPSHEDYVILDDYSFSWLLLDQYFQETTYDQFINPWSNQEFSMASVEEIKNKLTPCRSIISCKPLVESNISTETLQAVYTMLVVPLSQDYDQKSGFECTCHALLNFNSYLERLKPEEKTCLNETIVEWKKPEGFKKFKILRTKFHDINFWTSNNELCHHLAAVYFWQFLNQVDPGHYSSAPKEVTFTSNYWGGMLDHETKDKSPSQEKTTRTIDPPLNSSYQLKSDNRT